MLSYVYQVTKYDPADRDGQGRYVGVEDSVSDHGSVEAAYLEAVAAFASDTGVRQLSIREPELVGINFGLEPAVAGYGLAELFPESLSGFHDGAVVPVEVGLELVRAMLRDNGAWCRLEVECRFLVHVGYDQYFFVGSSQPCERAVARTRALGLFPERLDRSPYDIELNEVGERRPADSAFWGQAAALVAAGHAGLLEENPVGGVSRWYRLVEGEIEEIRERLTPRARVAVWPGLSADLMAVLDSLPEDHLVQLVWEDQDGRIRSLITDEARPETLDGARAAMALSCIADEQPPLLAAVLPDEDGILRARWGTERDQEHLRSVHRGQ
jgi:small subunit ribosomal protein S1